MKKKQTVTHVAFIVKNFGIGGLERCIARIANELNRDLFKASIICLNKPGDAENWIEKDDVNIYELGYPTGNNLRLVGSLARTLTRIKADIAHSHNWATLSETFAACKLTKTVRHLHAERGTLLNSSSQSGIKNWVRRKIFSYTINRTDHCMSNARSIAEKITLLSGLKSTDITIIPNGLDCPYTVDELSELRSTTRKRLQITDQHCLIGSVGRLHSVKNFELAIRSFGDARQKLPNSRLMIIGDGPNKKKLEKTISELGLQASVALGGNQQDAWPFIAALDIYINTSVSEGMSQSLVEAMAAGKPIVATDVGDTKHLITSGRRCGKVVPVNQSNRFSEALYDLASNEELQHEYGKNALAEHAQRYSMRKMVNSFENLYISLDQRAKSGEHKHR